MSYLSPFMLSMGTKNKGAVMAKMELTKRNIDKIPFTTGGQVDYWDTKI